MNTGISQNTGIYTGMNTGISYGNTGIFREIPVFHHRNTGIYTGI